MKKFILVLAMVAILATGTAFADHPSGTGIGVMGLFGGHWHSGYGGYGGAALSLKLPTLPIFWGVDLSFHSGYFSLGVMGDYYLVDAVLVPDLKLHWFLGLGGWAKVTFYEGFDGLGLGARLPIGLSWQPIPLLEIFLDVAPSLGLGFNSHDPVYFPAGGCQGEIGLRLWF